MSNTPTHSPAEILADMPARAIALLARIREQDRVRGFSFECDYLWTAKVPGESSPAEMRARFEECGEARKRTGYALSFTTEPVTRTGGPLRRQ